MQKFYIYLLYVYILYAKILYRMKSYLAYLI